MGLKSVAVAVLGVVLAASGGPSPVAAEPALDQGFVRSPGTVVVDTVDPTLDPHSPEIRAKVEDVRQRIAIDRGQEPVIDLPEVGAGLNGQIRAAFGSNVPSNVRTVVNAAIADWDAALRTTLPIVIDVDWECFNSPGLLGFAGPIDIYEDPSLPGNVVVPAALAHTRAGTDLNGSTSEIEMGLNAELAADNNCAFSSDDWYISTDDDPDPGQIDLYSVVLHEIGHGLGFLGSARDPDGGGAAPPQLGVPRFHYDTFAYSGDARLVDMLNISQQLTAGNLFFDIGGGRMYELYAPSPFRNGSSFSHFDTSIVANDPGVLMTPSLGSGVVRRRLDAPILGVLGQQGWDVIPRAVTPTITSTPTAAGEVTVVWDPNLDGFGTPPLSYRVEATRNGDLVATKVVDGDSNSATLNQLTNGASYDLRVVPADDDGSAAAATGSVTLPPLPNRPQFVESDGIGLSRSVSWQAPAPVSGGALTYEVQSRRVGGSWSTLGTTSATAMTTPRLDEEPYQFRVRATNGNGTGQFGLSTIIGVSDGLVRPLPLDGQVGRLYSAYFLRQPDQLGYDYWLRQRASGTSLATISAAFESSPEFQDLYGSLSDSEFVDRVYQNVQGRTPDRAGKAFWLGYLAAGNSRGSLMIGFSESGEYIDRTGTVGPTKTNEGKIYRLYLAFFQREPDAGGLDFWVGRYNNGSSLSTIANGFVDSEEFQAEYGSLPDDRFVELVYANVLTREADAGGYAFWASQLSSGASSEGSMMVGFSESLEFILTTGSLPS